MVDFGVMHVSASINQERLQLDNEFCILSKYLSFVRNIICDYKSMNCKSE